MVTGAFFHAPVNGRPGLAGSVVATAKAAYTPASDFFDRRSVGIFRESGRQTFERLHPLAYAS